MQVEFSSVFDASSQNPEGLEKIRALIKRVLADRCLSRQERDTLMQALYKDKKVTPAECELFNEIQAQIRSGDIQIED
ncbi:MAG: hypothetical protein SFW36_13915 [Leptolyngbyaceae cyanobacterium bins.59]|nr:hypothetical protein [Leptolyngbyaceae cyanobacterium bins.59]